MKSEAGYWVYKLIDGIVVKRRPTQQEIIQAEKASIKNVPRIIQINN